MDVIFTKTRISNISAYVPGDPSTEEWDQKIKIGENVHGPFRKMRNPLFHRKFFALLNLAFEYWEPGEINSKYGVPEKNFDRFRKDLTILAGHYHIVARLDCTAGPEADSISFGNMDQDTFERLYNSVLNVILKKINVLKDMTKDEVNDLVNKVLEFG
jgi:hypothetical protein